MVLDRWGISRGQLIAWQTELSYSRASSGAPGPATNSHANPSATDPKTFQRSRAQSSRIDKRGTWLGRTETRRRLCLSTSRMPAGPPQRIISAVLSSGLTTHHHDRQRHFSLMMALDQEGSDPE